MFAVIGSLIVESRMQSADQTLYSPITHIWFFLQILYLKCLLESFLTKISLVQMEARKLGIHF